MVIAPVGTGWSRIPDLKDIRFTGDSGLLVPVPNSSPIDYFSLLVDDNFLISVVDETNIYAEQLFLTGPSERARITNWKPLDLPELKIFLGLWLHMGTIQLNRMQDYWRQHELFSIPCFPKYMSRNRFLLIMRCLHFSRNPDLGEAVSNDRMQKIRPVQNFLNEKMDQLYCPGKELSIDESMVLWRGRLQFRQYIKNKKHKYGLKLYLLTEPNGMVLRCLLYTGAADDLGGKGHAANIVLALMEGKLGKGYSIYMDNFYNSTTLAKQLLSKDTYVTGTLRKDRRDNPKDLVQTKLRKGDSITFYNEGVAVTKWHDKRDVLVLSTEFTGENVEIERRRGDNQIKPKAVVMYNKYMSGIDRQDQMLAYYPSERKTIRWYKKIFIHYMSMLLFNSFLLYSKYSGSKITFFDYRLSVIQQLLSHKIFPQAPIPTEPVGNQHLPSRYRNQVSGKPMRKRCKVCYKKNIQKLTQFFCSECPDCPGLCMEPCFREYHVE